MAARCAATGAVPAGGRTGDSTRESFREAGGFCRAHARLLRAVQPGGEAESLTVLTFYGRLLGDVLDTCGPVAAGATMASEVRLPRAWRRQPRVPPAATRGACLDITLATLERGLSPLRGVAGLRKPFRHSRDLCLPHLRLLLPRVRDPGPYGLPEEVHPTRASRARKPETFGRCGRPARRTVASWWPTGPERRGMRRSRTSRSRWRGSSSRRGPLPGSTRPGTTPPAGRGLACRRRLSGSRGPPRLEAARHAEQLRRT